VADLAAGEDLDPKAPSAHFFNELRQSLGQALDGRALGPGRGHPPLDFLLGHDVGSVGDGGCRGNGHRATRLRDEPASVGHPILLDQV
jgi:hypothetical protein